MAGTEKKQSPLAWFNSRSLRERAVLVGAVVVLILVLALVLVFDPLSKRQQALQRDIATLENSLVQLQAQETTLLSRKNLDPDREKKQRLQLLEAETEKLQGQLELRIDTLVSPSQMTLLLKDLLDRQADLRLLSLKNLPPEAVDLGTPGQEKDEAPQLYRHGLDMELSGKYLAMLNYLRELQQLPRGLVWDTVEIETSEYPKTTVHLKVYTLSLVEGWIGG